MAVVHSPECVDYPFRAPSIAGRSEQPSRCCACPMAHRLSTTVRVAIVVGVDCERGLTSTNLFRCWSTSRLISASSRMVKEQNRKMTCMLGVLGHSRPRAQISMLVADCILQRVQLDTHLRLQSLFAPIPNISYDQSSP